VSSFSEKDVRRCYDLLQHDPELGLSQLLAMDSDRIIGLGLFDNEEDFLSECLRYNTLGDLFVGVNPRSIRLLDQFGGLKNRMRSVFVDVSDPSMIDHITGIAVPEGVELSDQARARKRDLSLLHEREMFFALGKPLPISAADHLADWVVGSNRSWSYQVDQYIRVPGTAVAVGGFFSRRVTFRRYRPYQLPEVSDAVLVDSETAGIESSPATIANEAAAGTTSSEIQGPADKNTLDRARGYDDADRAF